MIKATQIKIFERAHQEEVNEWLKNLEGDVIDVKVVGNGNLLPMIIIVYQDWVIQDNQSYWSIRGY